MILTSRSRATGPRSDIFSRHYFDDTSVKITGQYSVVLPDCRIQTVTYSVRPETGFVVSWAAQIHSAGAPCLTAPCCRPRSPTPTWAAAVSPPRPASRTSTGAAASGAARAAAAELRPGTAVR